MATIVGIVFPIFALIGLGYLGRRLGLLTDDAAAALSGYVYYFSLPALLYVKVAEVPPTKSDFAQTSVSFSQSLTTFSSTNRSRVRPADEPQASSFSSVSMPSTTSPKMV